MDDKSSTKRLLNLLTAKNSDNQRYANINIIKCNLLKNVNVKETVGKVNKNISVAATRDKGFELLSELLEFLPVNVINENAVSWIKIALGQRPKGEVKPLKLSIIGRLIHMCNSLPEFRKIVVADHLAEIVEACLKTDNSVLPQHSLTCLSSCLLKFPSSCLPFKTNIETSLSQCLDYQGEDLAFVKKAAVAFHYVNQIGGAGNDGINHQKNWTEQLEKLCSSTKKMIVELNDEISESDMVESVGKKIRNHLIFIKTMLEKSYPVLKVIPLETVLDVISVGVDNHECYSTSTIVKAQISSVLAKLQIYFLHLLRSFIACTRQKVIPFSLTINKILVNCLRRIHSCDCFKTSSEHITAAYSVLNYWIKTAGNAFHHSFHEKLIRFILNDISVVEQKLTLQLNTGTNKKKAVDSGKSSLISKDALGIRKFRERSCACALETLKELLKSTYLKINIKLTKELNGTLTKALLTIQSGKTIDPYTDPNCQLLLYQAVISLFDQPYLSVPPSLHVEIHLLNFGRNSKDSRIASVCQEGLNKLELLCQPICPTLKIGSEKPAEESSVEVEEKKIRILSDIVIKPTENGIIINEHLEREEVRICEDADAGSKDNAKSFVISSDNVEESIEICSGTDEPSTVRNEKEEASVSAENDQKYDADENDFCLVIEDDDSVEETVEQNGETDYETSLGNGEEEDVVEIVDEPPLKKNKTSAEDSEESLLDSFVNVVNDY